MFFPLLSTFSLSSASYLTHRHMFYFFFLEHRSSHLLYSFYFPYIIYLSLLHSSPVFLISTTYLASPSLPLSLLLLPGLHRSLLLTPPFQEIIRLEATPINERKKKKELRDHWPAGEGKDFPSYPLPCLFSSKFNNSIYLLVGFLVLVYGLSLFFFISLISHLFFFLFLHIHTVFVSLPHFPLRHYIFIPLLFSPSHVPLLFFTTLLCLRFLPCLLHSRRHANYWKMATNLSFPSPFLFTSLSVLFFVLWLIFLQYFGCVSSRFPLRIGCI